MSNLNPSSVTLIFYRLGPLRQEPLLNIVASALQWSSFCHTEIAIGENRTPDGAMVNVARVFNDSVGVELTARTGRNPNYVYIQLGCSELATQRMLQFARAQVGKPFSQIGMARSIMWPRKTDWSSWYCAELTAAVLQVGGLLHKQSNPGAATPSSLYELFAPRAAVAANPFKIHLLQQHHKQQQENQHDSEDAEPLLQLGLRGAFSTPARTARTNPGGHQRQHFKSLATHPQMCTISNTMLTSGLTLNSLTTPTPLPPLPGEVSVVEPPWKRQKRDCPASPPGSTRLASSFEEAAFASMWETDEPPKAAAPRPEVASVWQPPWTVGTSSEPACGAEACDVFRSIRGNHAGILRECGGVREFMKSLQPRGGRTQVEPPPRCEFHKDEPPPPL